MGGAASIGQNNDELVEYLLDTGYIHRKEVELVFRAVDRADYVLSSQQESAYKDLAWKHGNLHLSAPCVYGVAMEFLRLRPGQSFLNIGSGTGYFSTMAGFLLGTHGINHGIELHEDCVQYARERLEHFKQNSQALEEFEFCEPSFVQGNCLRVEPTREYDAVYCGAAVSHNHIAAVKRFVRVKGIIVLPYKGRLCCFTRVSENNWRCEKALGVSFAGLVIPDPTDHSQISLPDAESLSLQELCRSKVRQILRENIWAEHPELKKRNLSTPDRQPLTVRTSQQVDEGMSNDEDDDDDGDDDDDDDIDIDVADAAADSDFIGRARFLFHMEDEGNDAAINTLQLRRVARLVQQDRHMERQRDSVVQDRGDQQRRATEASSSISPCWGPSQSVAEYAAEHQSSSRADNQRTDTRHNFVVDFPSVVWNGTETTHNRNEESTSEQNKRNKEEESESESDNDNDSDTDSDSECHSEEKFPTKWKKTAKRKNMDSGIVEDMNPSYDDTSSSLNADHLYCENEDDEMEVEFPGSKLRENFQRVYRNHFEDTNPSQPSSGENNVPVAKSVESRLFITFMKEKIQLLPLPNTMKIYINQNRNL